MKKARLRTLGFWFAGTYLAWSLFIYFGSYGHNSHAWWPMFLYPIIFPCSWIFEEVFKPILEFLLIPDPTLGPPSAFMRLDHFAGCFYILVGTIWCWFIGKVIAAGVTRVFPPNAAKNGPAA